MTSIPTVIYGFVSVIFLVPLVREAFPESTGYSWLTAALTLSLMILPTIVLLVHAQLQQVDARVRLASAALGFSPAQTLLWVMRPLASRGLWAAAVLGFSRALGDTIIALMVAGNAPQVPHSLLDSIRTLTSHIALVVATDSTSQAYQSIFASGLILFGITAAVNLTLRRLQSGEAAGALRLRQDHLPPNP
jgi:phosphate transport system permease protein